MSAESFIILLKSHALLIWRTALVTIVFLFFLLVMVLFLRSSRESEEAFAVGRRVTIDLNSGEVLGKILTLDGTVADTKKTADTAVTAADAASQIAAFNSALSEHTDAGTVPAISSDGTKPWRYYSKPFERRNSQPMIAIVVTGLGHSADITTAAIKLPDTIALSFSPYAPLPDNWNNVVRATSHEMLVDLPLEPNNYPATDPGPQGLLVDNGTATNDKRLQWLMSRYQTYIGFVTPQSEVYTSNDESFKALTQSLSTHGLMLLLGKEPHKKETKDALDAGTTANIISDVLIDEELSAGAIKIRLAALEEQAQKHGYAVGIAQAYPITIDQLQEWSKTLAEKGLVLVPISAIAKLRFS